MLRPPPVQRGQPQPPCTRSWARGRPPVDGQRGTYFAVWAPDANAVCVIGDFNDWNKAVIPCACPAAPACGKSSSPAAQGQVYKFEIGCDIRTTLDKSDPYGFYTEARPGRPPSSRTCATAGTTRGGWQRDAHERLAIPSRSTKFTWARGGDPGRGQSLAQLSRNRRPSWRNTSRWVLRTWN